MRIPVLDLKAQYARIRAEVEPRVLEICASQSFVLGPEVEAFEHEMAAYVRAPHAVACASGTDALVLGLRACGVGVGDEVITPSFTFMASAGAVALCGARPVFVDIEPQSFNLDAAKLVQALSKRTRAIIAVDLFGQCADMTAVLDIAAEHDLVVIEDAAQSIGAEHRGRRAGEMARLTTFSFYPSKNLGGFGDGGMITSNDSGLAQVLRKLRVHGESSRYIHDLVGTNSRLDALQAAVLRIKLRHLDRWTAERQAHAEAYARAFDAAALGDDLVQPRLAPGTTRHVFNQYTVRVRQRDALRDYLAQQGIGTAIYYPVPVHRQRCFADLWGADVPQLPCTDAAASEVLSLPLYPELESEQRDEVVERIVAFYAGPARQRGSRA